MIELGPDRFRHPVAIAGIGPRRTDEAGLAREVFAAPLVIPFEAAGRQHDALARPDRDGAIARARRDPDDPAALIVLGDQALRCRPGHDLAAAIEAAFQEPGDERIAHADAP